VSGGRKKHSAKVSGKKEKKIYFRLEGKQGKGEGAGKTTRFKDLKRGAQQYGKTWVSKEGGLEKVKKGGSTLLVVWGK